jgi:hypothetical protein
MHVVRPGKVIKVSSWTCDDETSRECTGEKTRIPLLFAMTISISAPEVAAIEVKVLICRQALTAWAHEKTREDECGNAPHASIRSNPWAIETSNAKKGL